MMRLPRIVTAAFCLLMLADTGHAASVNVQAYQPSPFARDLPSLSTTFIGFPLQLTAGFSVHYMANPLGFVGTDKFGREGLEKTLESRLMGEAFLSFAPTTWLDIGVAQPMVIMGTGKTSEEGFSGLGDLTGFAVGELRVSLKTVFLKTKAFRMGLQADMTVPTGDEAKLAANGLGGGPRLLFDFTSNRVNVALNAGAYLRPEEVEVGEFIKAGHELTGGLGLSIRVVNRFWIQGEAYFRTPLMNPFGTVNDTQLEYLAAVRWEPLDQLAISAGGGAGTPLFLGLGTSQYRFFLSMRWMMKQASSDSDDDGISDRLDRCPLFPEDVDGFNDMDGCPDPDNDGDGFLDDADQCPNEAEDKDGFEDEDGCPEMDNDGDGVIDTRDKCPLKPEDKDGFQDNDGCPESDNDRDGIPDKIDECPNQKETKNGFEDSDGCPDFSGVSVQRDRLVLTDAIKYAVGKHDVPARNFAGLRNMASLIKANRSWRKIKIIAHWDSTGSPSDTLVRTQAQASALLQFLVTEGVDFRRLVAEGRGGSTPTADNSTVKGQLKNRRVEFIIMR